MRKMLTVLTIAAAIVILSMPARGQGLLNLPLTNGEKSIQFTGAYLGFQAQHPAVSPAWESWDRAVYVSAGLRWRHFVGVSGELGFPTYRSNNFPRQTYFIVRLDLRLL